MTFQLPHFPLKSLASFRMLSGYRGNIRNCRQNDKRLRGSAFPDKTLAVCISGKSVNNEAAQETIQSGTLQPSLSLSVDVVLLLKMKLSGTINNRNWLWVIGDLKQNIPIFTEHWPVRLWRNSHSALGGLWQSRKSFCSRKREANMNLVVQILIKGHIYILPLWGSPSEDCFTCIRTICREKNMLTPEALYSPYITKMPYVFLLPTLTKHHQWEGSFSLFYNEWLIF